MAFSYFNYFFFFASCSCLVILLFLLFILFHCCLSILSSIYIDIQCIFLSLPCFLFFFLFIFLFLWFLVLSLLFLTSSSSSSSSCSSSISSYYSSCCLWGKMVLNDHLGDAPVEIGAALPAVDLGHSFSAYLCSDWREFHLRIACKTGSALAQSRGQGKI